MRVGLVVDIGKNYEKQIKHAVDLGFTSGQLTVWDMDFYTYENLEGLKKVLKELNFEPTALWCGWTGPVVWSYPHMYTTLGLVPDWMRQKRLEDLERGADFAYALGIKTIITHIGYTPDNPFDPARMAMVQGLKPLCKKLLDRGQCFAFETGEEIPVTLGMLITEIGYENVGVNFDPSNLYSGGRGNPNDALEYLMPRIFGFHAKDCIPAVFGEPKGKQVLIGTGRVDFKRLITQLHEAGYTGDITIEHEIKGTADRNVEVREAKKYLEDIISEVCK